MPRGLRQNMWHCLRIAVVGIGGILVVENCDLLGIKPHRESEFWGAGSRKHFEESLEIDFADLLCFPMKSKRLS